MEQQPNMMGNGMAPQNMMMNSMQRPQSGNFEQQIHAKVMEDLRLKLPTVPQGWQTTFELGQRATRIMQLVSGLRMLHQETGKCVQIAENFEERTFQESPNKEVYFEKMSKKMSEIYQKRQQAAQAMRVSQMGMPMNNGNMGMPQNGMGNMNNMQNLGMGGGVNMNMNNMGMGMGMNMNMGNNGMGMGMPNQMGGNGGQQNPNFPAQLQRQMQPSPLPLQQNQQPQNNTLDPSALQNPQMQQQMNQQQMQNMNQNRPQQTPRPQQPPNMNMNGQPQIAGGSQAGQEVINNARRIYDGLSEQKKDQIRNSLMINFNEQQRAAATKDGDPVFRFLVGKAKDQLIKARQQALLNQGAAQNGGGMQMGNNMNMNGNSAQQTPVSQPGAPNIDFSSIMGQQANAIKSQESGEQVVPASNNASMGLGGGQVNMSQGVNPQQLLANQNNQNANANQMQFAAMQQRLAQEKQRQMMMQNQIAQQQAMAQQQQNQNQNQLRGQPGGLNAPNALNGGQVNSPAMNMNMLNRPMAPPGQTTPSTPQPNRPQGMPQTPVNAANQLAQHHQTMVNQGNGQMNLGGQGATPAQQIMMSRFPQEVKDRLFNLPPEQQSHILQRIREQPQQYAAMMQSLQNGMPQQNMAMGGPQMANQRQMMSGMPPNMSNAVPAFNSQPPPNQDQGQNGQAAFSQKLQAHQFHLKQRAMDQGLFPKPVPQNLGIQAPEGAQTWGDLKRHIQQNQQIIPPNLLERLHQTQTQWYNAHPEELRQALAAFQQQVRNANQQGIQAQQGQQQAPPSARPPSAAPVPNGQAPPAQMVPPNAQMQQQINQVPNLNQMQLKDPTAEDILMFRQRVPTAQNMSDENIKQAMMRRKQAQYVQQMQQQQQNMRRAQALANGGQPPGAPDATAQQQQPRPGQQQPPQQQQPAPNQQMNMQGQKRQQSGSDDVMEIPNPNQQQMSAAQRPGMPMNQGLPPGVKMPVSREELAKMDQQTRLIVMQKFQQMDALRKAQAGNRGAAAPPQQPQPQPQAQQPSTLPQQQPGQAQPTNVAGVPPPEIKALDTRIKALWEEVQRTTPKGPPIQLDSQGLEQVQLSLKRLWTAVMNLDRTFYPALRAPQLGEERVKQAMKAKIVVQQNARDEKGNTKDYLSVNPTELKRLEVFVGQYFTALKELKARQDAARAQAQAAGATQAQLPPTQPAVPPAKPQQAQAPPAPQRKPSQQSNARKASAADRAPPAPTDKKTFDWGAQSPHGVPKYEPSQSQLTADKLKLPPQKKRRTAQQPESSESTPAAQTGTPQPAGSSPNVAGPKAHAAEQAKKMQTQVKVEAPKFKCDDHMCESSIRGFETEEMLKQHKDTVHKPVEDPFKFLTDALDAAEKNLKVEKPTVAPKAPALPRGKPVASALKKEGQTPDIKTDIGTPARPGSSVGKATSKPTPTPAGKKGADAKAPDSAVDVPEEEKSLLESMAGKIGFDLPVIEPPESEAPVEVTDNLFEDLLLDAQTSDGSLFINEWSDLNDFSGITDWGLRPEPESSPDLTPSDGTSQSSRESDISQTERLRINLEWDAFGNGDTGVPDVLLQTLGLGDDTTMADAGAEKKAGEDKKDDSWNWNSDLMDWDSMFGPNAGLGENDGAEFGIVL